MTKRIRCSIAVAGFIFAGLFASSAQADQVGPNDIPAPSGTHPITGQPWKAGDKYYIMFTSSTLTNATNSNIAAYDAFVNAAADTSTIDGVPETTWYALASTATVDARDRGDLGGGVQTNPVYVMEDLVQADPGSSVTLRKVWNDEAHMWSGQKNHGEEESPAVYPFSKGRLDYDESGLGVASQGDARVWTGTQGDGTDYIGTGGLGTATPRQGQCDTDDGAYWIGRFNPNNTNSFHIYAISEELTIQVGPLSMGAASAESITTSGADLVGTVDTGADITSWGSFWGTNTVDITNETATTGSASAPFTFTNTIASGMPVGAQVTYYAWASNAADGLKVSATNDFYTEPLQVSGLTFTETNDHDVTFSWTKGTVGADTLVIVRQDDAVSGGPVDGTNYAADASFTGSGDALGDGKVVYAGSGTGVTITDLMAATPYHVALYAYAGSGNLINYQQDGGVTGNAETTGTRPALGITNAVTPVAHGTSSTTIGGTNNSEVVGTLTWTNAANAATGTMNAGTGPGYSWISGSITLEYGANEITVTGTNAAGVSDNDSVTVTRAAEELPEVGTDLVIHCTFDNTDVHLGGTYPPPALDSEIDGDFTIDDIAGSEDDATTETYIQSSTNGVIGEAIHKYDSNSRGLTFGDIYNHVAGQGLTVSFWARPDFVNEGRVMISDGEDSSNAKGWSMQGVNNGTDAMRCVVDGGTAYDVIWEDTYSAGTWYHYVMVIDPFAVPGEEPQGRVIGYVDSVGSGVSGEDDNWKVGSNGNAFDSTTSFSVNAPIMMGNRNSAHANAGFKGRFDDLAVWTDALTEGEARSLYTLATSSLNYNAYYASALWYVADNGGAVTIGNVTWYRANGLVGNPGDIIVYSGDKFALVLDDNGNGVSTKQGGTVLVIR